MNNYIISGINGNVGKLFSNYFVDYDIFDKSVKSSNSTIFIHLASKSYGNYREIIKSNIGYLIKTITFCKQNGIKNFIFFSAFSINNKDDFYSNSKLFGESILRESGLNVLILRLPMILTHNKTNGILNRIVTKLENNEKIDLYNSEQRFNNFICVHDIVHFIKAYSFKKKYEIINIASNCDHTLYEIIFFIKEILHSKSIINKCGSQDNMSFIDTSKLIIEYKFCPSDTKEVLSNWLLMRNNK